MINDNDTDNRKKRVRSGKCTPPLKKNSFNIMIRFAIMREKERERKRYSIRDVYKVILNIYILEVIR